MRPTVQGRGAGAREQDRPHPRHGGRLFLSAEPAQPHLADAAPARFGDQAAHLSHGAAEGAAAEHAGARRADHAAADRRRGKAARGRETEKDYWTPRNADNGSGGRITLRRGLENSRNLVTARLLDGGIDPKPEQSLDEICATAVAAKIYRDCVRYYPFVLGAQPVRMIDLAAFYAAVANEGARPQPHAHRVDRARTATRFYQYPNAPLPWIGTADRASFYQLKTMLQGVVARGTARAINSLSPYVAGKTGTTEDENDGWFVGFTNDVTVAVWVGYDNADGKRRTLGTSADRGAASRCRSSSRSSGRSGPRGWRPRRRSVDPRKRPSVISSICRSTTTAGIGSEEGVALSSISGSRLTAVSTKRNISLFRASTPIPRGTRRTSAAGPVAGRTLQPRAGSRHLPTPEIKAGAAGVGADVSTDPRDRMKYEGDVRARDSAC